MTPQKRPRKAIQPFQLLFWLLIPILLFMPALASAWETTIDKVHDGDTFEITPKGHELDVRFYGLACAEKGQLYGMKAKRFVQRMYQEKTVGTAPAAKERYGRITE